MAPKSPLRSIGDWLSLRDTFEANNQKVTSRGWINQVGPGSGPPTAGLIRAKMAARSWSTIAKTSAGWFLPHEGARAVVQQVERGRVVACTHECVTSDGLQLRDNPWEEQAIMHALHAGLDVADQTVSVCIVDATGQTILEETCATTPKAIAAILKPYRRRLRRVGQETGTKSTWLHNELSKQRLPMVCLDARHTKAALAAKPNKTDKNDARGIAKLLAGGLFTIAHIKSDEARAIRLLLAVRKTLQRKALDLEVSLTMMSKSFGAPIEKKRRRVTKPSKARDRELQHLFDLMARTSCYLMHEVKALDRLVRQAASADPVCRRLMTIPGVGPISALTFRAAVDDPSRFRSSRDVAAHFGLTPRRFQSGQQSHSGHITGIGDPTVRAALYDAAASLLNCSRSRCALRQWGLRLRQRQGFKPAAVACARKLACLMHRMWVTGQDFDDDPPRRTSGIAPE